MQNNISPTPLYIQGFKEAFINSVKRNLISGTSINKTKSISSRDISKLENLLDSLLSNWNQAETKGSVCTELSTAESSKTNLDLLFKSHLIQYSSEFNAEGSPWLFPNVSPFIIDKSNPSKVRLYSQRTFVQEALLAFYLSNLYSKKESFSNLSYESDNKKQPTRNQSKKLSTSKKDRTKELDQYQKEAVENLNGQHFYILSGGPGTGKTFTIAHCLEKCLQARKNEEDLTIYLSAPTGKARSKLVEAINIEAKDLPLLREKIIKGKVKGQTIHRWLSTNTKRGKFPSKDNPLECDLLVIDETSMLDSEIAFRLFSAIDPEKTSVLMLGDKDQLAAVGPGSIFASIVDLANALEKNINFLELDHRFDPKSGISLLAKSINRKEDIATKLKKVNEILDSEQQALSSPTSTTAKASTKNLKSKNSECQASILFPNLEFQTGEDEAEIKGHVQFIKTQLEDNKNLSDSAEKVLESFLSKYVQTIKSIKVGKNEDPKEDDLKRILETFKSFRALAAQRKGSMSVDAINKFCEKKFKELMEGERGAKKRKTSSEEEHFFGKPVIVLRNDPVLDVANGEEGILYKHYLTERKDQNNSKDSPEYEWYLYIGSDKDEDSDEKEQKVKTGKYPKKEEKVIGNESSDEVSKSKHIPVLLLPEYETAFAITIHKAQGSGYKEVAIFLPHPEEINPNDSKSQKARKEERNKNLESLATRELLYTAITRAEKNCVIFGTQDILEKCIRNKTERTGGLSDRLLQFIGKSQTTQKRKKVVKS